MATDTSKLEKKKFLIDVDPGVDDAQALVMALSRPEVEVVGVTVVHGNVPLRQTLTNALRILELCERLDVPVFPGCDSAIISHESCGNATSARVHGIDGLGNKPTMDPKPRENLDLLQKEHASSAICRLAKEHKGELTLIALAPLTNVAVALKLDPKLPENLKETIIMGGNSKGEGNTTTPCAEFNFWKDPEAAQMCVSALSPTIITFACCRDVVMPWEWYDTVEAMTTPKARFMNAVNSDRVKVRRNTQPHYYTCDPTAMAIAIDPRAAESSEKRFCQVELAGSATRGMMVIDWMGYTGNAPNATVVTNTRPEIIMGLFEGMLK